MNKFKKYFAYLSLFTILGTSAVGLTADECCDDGCAYDDCRRAPVISPQCAIGAIAVVATVAVVLHNSKQGHNPGHSSHNTHSHSHSH